MRISHDVYVSHFYPGSWLRVYTQAGLFIIDGYELELTSNLPELFARPVVLKEVLPPLCHLVLAEAYDCCTLDGSLRREWATAWLRDLGVTDRGLELLLTLVKRYASPQACALAAYNGAVR
jgi:hypothetical protein